MPDTNLFISPSEWTMTDDDCLQHCRSHPAIDPQVYELVQINSYPGHVDGKPFYHVAHAHIDLKEYSEKEILDALNAYGYEDMDDFVFQNSPTKEYIYKEDGTLDRENSPSYIIEYQLIAEMLFELECQEYTDNEYSSWNAAVDRVAELTGLELQQYHDMEEYLPEAVSESLIFGERESDAGRTAFITTPAELAKTFGLDDQQLVEELMKTRNNFGKSVYAIYEKGDEHYYLRIADRIGKAAGDAVSYIAASIRNGKYSNFETPSASTRKAMTHLLTPIFAAGFSDVQRDHNVMDAVNFADNHPHYVSALHDVFTSFHLLDVNRERMSVTQGSVLVSCLGQTVVRYGDDMWLATKNGAFSNGFRVLSKGEHYGPVIGGWGSLKSDETFAKAALVQYPQRLLTVMLDPTLTKEAVPSLDTQISAAGSKRTTAKKEQPARLQSIEMEH